MIFRKKEDAPPHPNPSPSDKATMVVEGTIDNLFLIDYIDLLTPDGRKVTISWENTEYILGEHRRGGVEFTMRCMGAKCVRGELKSFDEIPDCKVIGCNLMNPQNGIKCYVPQEYKIYNIRSISIEQQPA